MLDKLKVYLYGLDQESVPSIITRCRDLVLRDHEVVSSTMEADIAIAPLLTTFLTPAEIETPRLGTLVFHPSLLPRHRGSDAIKWAFALGETYSGVTWFWPDEGIDTGDLCEQEVTSIDPDESPREYYERAVIPAALRTLERALTDLQAGIVRRVPQRLEHGSYEARYKKDPETNV